MSSRLALDSHGRLVAVVTVPQPGCGAGYRFVVLGNALPAAERGFYFLGTPTGRRNGHTKPRKTVRDWAPVDLAP